MDHDYQTEVIVQSDAHLSDHDSLNEIRRSLVTLTSTVHKLVANQNSMGSAEGEEEPSAYPKSERKHALSRDSLSLNGGSDSADSLYDPGAPQSKRTSYNAERTNRDACQTSLQAVKGSKAASITGVSSLFDKPNQPTAEAYKALQVDEDILCAVESERPPVTCLPEGDPILPNLADRVKRYMQTDARNLKHHQEAYKNLLTTY